MAKRINFATFLDTGETEWQNEQAYHRQRILNHIIEAHGAGVLRGLKPQQDSPASLDVLISPGYAVDANGEELVVETQQTVSLASYVPGSGTQTVYIVAEYQAQETDPVYLDEINETHNSMIEDTVTITAQTTAPTASQIELGRVSLVAGATAVTDAADPFTPLDNEIDLTHRDRLPLPFQGGPASDRPRSPVLYEQYFAADLASGNGKLIIWNGTNWVDAVGTVVY